MKALVGIAGLVVAGVLTWQIGGRLSTDAVGMGVGLVFGVLAGVPAALLVLATARRADDDDYDDDDVYQAGYRQGISDTTDLARGMARQLPDHDKISAEWHAAYERQRAQPPVIVVDAPAQYTLARPFGPPPQLPLPERDPDAPASTLVGEVIGQCKERCATWELCPNCHWPITPDENCPVECGFPAPDAAAQRLVAAAVQVADMQAVRQFRLVGEVE